MHYVARFLSDSFFHFRLSQASALAITVTLVLPSAVIAADFNVPSGTTETTTQILPDAGDTGTVEQGGAINTTGTDAVAMLNANQTLTNNGDLQSSGVISSSVFSNGDNAAITNNGTITSSGWFAFGIESFGLGATIVNNGTITTNPLMLPFSLSPGIYTAGDNSSITNNGSVTTLDDDADAVRSDGNNSTVTNGGTVSTSGDVADGLVANGTNSNVNNSGTVTTTGDFSAGIDADGDGSTATNSGTVSTSGDNAHGVDADANSLTITNTNRITVTGQDSDAIDVDGDDANVTNTGTLSAAGTQGNGIDINGDNAMANNSGSISVSGTNANGVEVGGDNASVVNSGGVFSQNGSSFSMEGPNALLTLNPGSVVQGLITYLDPATSSFAFSAERTAILTFAGLPNTITTGTLPSWVSGSTLTIVDPQDFRLDTTDDVLNALTGGIADAVGDHLHNGRRNSGAGGLVATSGGPASPIATTYLAPPGISVWGSVLGNVLSRSGSDGFDHYSAGLLAGVDKDLSAVSRGGVFGGFSLGRTDGGSTAYSSETMGVFLGGYWSTLFGNNFLDLIASAGYLGSDDDVTILNNLVQGGLQNVSLGYNSLFISPSATVGHVMGLENGSKFEPSVRLRYSGLFQLNSANETTTRFSVADRILHVFEVRGQVAHDFAPRPLETGALHFGLKAGVDGIFNIGGSQNASLNGAAINLSVSDDNAVARGFARADLRLVSDPATEIAASVEGGYDTAATLSAKARIGFVRRF